MQFDQQPSSTLSTLSRLFAKLDDAITEAKTLDTHQWREVERRLKKVHTVLTGVPHEPAELPRLFQQLS